VTASPTSQTFNSPITFTAVVSPTTSSAGAPPGTVTFLEGTTTLGSGTLAPVSGHQQATFTTSSLNPGSHTITARYNATTGWITSSSTVTVTVIAPATTLTLTSSLNPARQGQAITFTARVGAGGGHPTGSVSFYYTNSRSRTSLGTATLNASGVATLTVSTLPVGTDPIVALYTGDGTFNGSVSNTVNQSVTT
jgi:hypothetical protein